MSLPVDVLVTEHKLILQAVGLIEREIEQIQNNNAVDHNFIATAVDFFRTYADRFHHGKEEGILFRELSQRQLKDTDQKIMKDLMIEHTFARRTVTALEKEMESYVSGQKEALNEVLDSLRTLVKLYPEHIQKEDKHFFYPCMRYFSKQEQQEMQGNFLEFNRNFTDKKYKQIIVSLTKG